MASCATKEGAFSRFVAWLRKTKCFVAGTPVWVAWQDKSGAWHIGTKPIEQIKQGEYVLSRNGQAGVTTYKRVLQTVVKQAQTASPPPLSPGLRPETVCWLRVALLPTAPRRKSLSAQAMITLSDGERLTVPILAQTQ